MYVNNLSNIFPVVYFELNYNIVRGYWTLSLVCFIDRMMGGLGG